MEPLLFLFFPSWKRRNLLLFPRLISLTSRELFHSASLLFIKNRLTRGLRCVKPMCSYSEHVTFCSGFIKRDRCCFQHSDKNFPKETPKYGITSIHREESTENSLWLWQKFLDAREVSGARKPSYQFRSYNPDLGASLLDSNSQSSYMHIL